MRKLFGTDGIRGVAGQEPLDAQTVFAAGRALAQDLKQHAGANPGVGPAPRVLLGLDTRISGPQIAGTLAAGLQHEGVQVVSAGVIPTPGVAHLAHTNGFAAGVVISASHNPWQDNGIKIFGGDGYKLPDAEELAIEESIFRLRDPLTVITMSHPQEDPALTEQYRQWLISQMNGRRLDGLQLTVDCANGAASKIAPAVLTALGAGVRAHNVTPDGKNINAACGALYPQAVAAQTVEDGSALGITFDGDADRALFASASGRVINGDGVMLLLARKLLRGGKLDGNTVVATTMSNMGLEAALRRDGITMLRAPVGDKYVLEKMQQTGAALGGEQSGHIIFARQATTGDGLLTALMFLSVLAEAGKSVDELLADLKTYPQVIENIHVREKVPLDEIPAVVDAIQAAEMELAETGRVVVRYSGTEKLARVMIEAESEEAMRRHAAAIADAIRNAVGA